MTTGPRNFPLAEGIGIFVGIVAWDMLVEGHAELIRPLGIATVCSLIWYGVRLWRERPGGD